MVRRCSSGRDFFWGLKQQKWRDAPYLNEDFSPTFLTQAATYMFGLARCNNNARILSTELVILCGNTGGINHALT